MCKRPGKWERERAREREKGKGKEDIYYYTGTLPAAAQSRKPGIQGGALAIFFCSFLKAKRVSVLCQKVDQQTQSRKQEKQGGALAIFFFYFLESKRVSVLCRNVDQDLVDLWSLLGHFGGLFEAF